MPCGMLMGDNTPPPEAWHQYKGIAVVVLVPHCSTFPFPPLFLQEAFLAASTWWKQCGILRAAYFRAACSVTGKWQPAWWQWLAGRRVPSCGWQVQPTPCHACGLLLSNAGRKEQHCHFWSMLFNWQQLLALPHCSPWFSVCQKSNLHWQGDGWRLRFDHSQPVELTPGLWP